MKKLLFIFIFTPFLCVSQNKNIPIKLWSETDTLLYSDFVNKEISVFYKDSIHANGMIFNGWKSFSSVDSIIDSIRNIMYYDSSFIVINDESYVTLKHEQAHFDISEIYLRMFLNSISKIHINTDFSSFNELTTHLKNIDFIMDSLHRFFDLLEDKRQESFHKKIESFENLDNRNHLEIEESIRIRDSLINNFNFYKNGNDFFAERKKIYLKQKKYFDYFNKFMMQEDSIKNPLVKEYQNIYSKYKTLHNKCQSLVDVYNADKTESNLKELNKKKNDLKIIEILLKERENEMKTFYYDFISDYEIFVNLFPDFYKNIPFLQRLGNYYYDNKKYNLSAKNYAHAIKLKESQINNSEKFDEMLNNLYESIANVYDALNMTKESIKIKVKRNMRYNNKL